MEQTACIGPVFRAFRYSLEHPPRASTARTARLDRPSGPGWAAAGDAAMALDPLSSRGILTALWTGTRCGEALNGCLTGDADGIRRYAEDLEIAFADYLREQAEYYSIERRWAAQPFWQRRRKESHVVRFEQAPGQSDVDHGDFAGVNSGALALKPSLGAANVAVAVAQRRAERMAAVGVQS